MKQIVGEAVGTLLITSAFSLFLPPFSLGSYGQQMEGLARS
jgi:hypothetical protein